MLLIIIAVLMVVREFILNNQLERPIQKSEKTYYKLIFINLGHYILDVWYGVRDIPRIINAIIKTNKIPRVKGKAQGSEPKVKEKMVIIYSGSLDVVHHGNKSLPIIKYTIRRKPKMYEEYVAEEYEYEKIIPNTKKGYRNSHPHQDNLKTLRKKKNWNERCKRNRKVILKIKGKE